MNETTETKYIIIGEQQASALNFCALAVNDWATKKGWNQLPTPEKEVINRAISLRMLAIAVICEDIEGIRTGNVPHVNVMEAIGILGATTSGLSGPVLADVAQYGLMATELAEATEARITGKEWDDHVPELSAEAAELADLKIRIFHHAGKKVIDIGRAVVIKHEYNTRRPYMHGKKA